MKKRTRKELISHFWSKVVKGKKKECWRWSGAHFSEGYPMFHVDRVPVQATRFMLKLVNGKMPEMALHDCDNRWCVNPNHLYDGSQKDNMKDRMERGIYHTRFTGHKRAKLTGSKFEKFRIRVMAGEKPFVIAPEFGIHGSTACRIAQKLYSK